MADEFDPIPSFFVFLPPKNRINLCDRRNKTTECGWCFSKWLRPTDFKNINKPRRPQVSLTAGLYPRKISTSQMSEAIRKRIQVCAWLCELLIRPYVQDSVVQQPVFGHKRGVGTLKAHLTDFTGLLRPRNSWIRYKFSKPRCERPSTSIQPA